MKIGSKSYLAKETISTTREKPLHLTKTRMISRECNAFGRI